MKKLTLFLFTIASLAGPFTANAQRTDSLKTKDWFMQGHDVTGTIQIQVTYRKGDISQLDQVLNNNGIPTLKEYDIWFNASMSHFHNNWLTEDGIGFTPVATSSANNVDVKYNQYQAYFRVGYNFSQNTSFRLYPFVGANLSAGVLNIKDNGGIQSTNNFSTELLNSTATKTFYQPNFGIELGAGFDYAIKLAPKQMGYLTVQRSIPIGVRAGYYINTYASDWRIYSYTPEANNPNQKQSALFVSFNIGLGYEIKK